MLPDEGLQSRGRRQELPSGSLALVEALPMLVDSLLHDARNPLNALSINVEVLMERLRRDHGGELPPAYERNLRAIRDQVHRVDAILRRYADFISPRRGPDPCDLAQVVLKALELLGHESRKRKVTVGSSVEAVVRVKADSKVAHALAMHAVLRALARSPFGGEVFVSLRHEGRVAVLRVEDQGGESDAGTEALLALNAWSESQNGRIGLNAGGALEVHLPLATTEER